MIAFIEERFPVDIAYGASGGPHFHTEIVQSSSGFEYRNIRMPHSRHHYNLASAIKSEADLEKVLKFFRSVKGRAIGFRFRDWLDYRAQNEVIAVAQSSVSEYQLTKTYNTGLASSVRPIYKPIPGSVYIYVNGKRSLTCNVDHTTGIIKFHKRLKNNAVISADFEFDVPVRFDSDSISTSIDDYGVYSLQELPLVEVFLGN